MTDTTADPRYLRVENGVVEWRCDGCDQWTPFAGNSCRHCGQEREVAPAGGGASTSTSTDEQQPGETAVVAGNAGSLTSVAIAASVVLPGAGHVVLGELVAGLVRLVITSAWLGAGLFWWSQATTVAHMAARVLLAGVGLVWLTSLVDVVAIGRRRRQPCGARGLLWLVVGVTATFVAVVGLIASGIIAG